MRFLIFLLVIVLALGMTTTLAVAADGDCPGGVCPLQKTGKTLPSIVVNIPDVLEVTAVGIIAERQPVRSIVKSIEGRPPARNIAIGKGLVVRKPGRSVVKRVLKFPRRLLRRRR